MHTLCAYFLLWSGRKLIFTFCRFLWKYYEHVQYRALWMITVYLGTYGWNFNAFGRVKLIERDAFMRLIRGVFVYTSVEWRLTQFGANS